MPAPLACMSASKESSYRLYIVLAGTLWCFYHPWQWPFVISLSSRFLTGAVAFRREKGFFLFFFCLCLINLPSIWQFWLGLARSYTHSFFFCSGNWFTCTDPACEGGFSGVLAADLCTDLCFLFLLVFSLNHEYRSSSWPK